MKDKSEYDLESIISRCVRDKNYRENINRRIDEVIDLLDAGHSVQYSPILELARSRIRVRKKYTLWNRLFLDEYSARYSTPEMIGKYRSGRIHGYVIDIGSGSGMQCIMFGLKDECLGIERERLRYLSSIINADVYGSKSRFRNDDFYSITDVSADIVFSDPLRMNTHDLRKLVPSPYDIMDRIKSDSYVFDVPPHTDLQTITFEGEKEYISVDGVLSRLTVYSGKLMEAEFSAHIMPAGIHITGSPYTGSFASPHVYDYIYVVDPAVAAAGLMEEFSDMALISRDDRRTVLSSESFRKDFPGMVFSVIGIYEWPDLEKKIAEIKPRKVYLRYGISSEDYYAITAKLEYPGGSGDLYIFKFSDRYVLANKIFDINYNMKANL
ncbi:SAM-dependent methyltransferase [Thermoplasma sp.]|uniref:SAM-dependent methyltransferase n=1 Tax=Thermoplasma sp. TaxID=1973142 RepID=UPI002610779F|nr:SAM-dependent methyltransferase [Thermoplasma sp.]